MNTAFFKKLIVLIYQNWSKIVKFSDTRFWDAKKIGFQPNNHIALQDCLNCQVFRHLIFGVFKKMAFSPVTSWLCKIESTVKFSDTRFLLDIELR